MSNSSARPAIRLRGVRHNNLKNFDLDLPLKQLVVITGLSGSGKSSLAFDTLFAEGQRRYIETFSPYARQFFDRMDKPQVDGIEGIPPAIAIEQRNAVRTTRSTVGTMTEICDYMKLLWPQIAQLHCRQCGRPVRKDSPQNIWECFRNEAISHAGQDEESNSAAEREVLVTFDLPLTEKLSLADCLALVAKQGYQRLLVRNEVVRLEDAAPRMTQSRSRLALLTVVQDRLKLLDANRARFVEACEQAYHFGKGKLTVHELAGATAAIRGNRRFSNRLHCADCDIEYREPTPPLFSFNHPLGACPTCRGFGRVIGIDYNLAMPDRSKTLAQGVVKPWQSGQSAECQSDLLRMCRHFEIPTDVPFEKLPKKWQEFVIEGEPGYGKDEEHEWPRAWYGIKGYFRWLESRAYKMHVRVLLSRYRSYTRCPDCQGRRFQPETLLYRVKAEGRRQKAETKAENGKLKPDSANAEDPGSKTAPEPVDYGAAGDLTLADFYALPIRDAVKIVQEIGGSLSAKKNHPLRLALEEVRSRLGYLDQVGLGYLTLDRPTRSLSGGETERVNLTTCLGTCLVNALFVLDEPSVGLHPRDTERLVRIIQQLRDAGNTVVVVEHESSVMRAANQIIDLGPGHGATGGQVVFQGSFPEILKSQESLTGKYLSGRLRIPIPEPRPVASTNADRTGAAGDRFRTGTIELRDAQMLYGQSSEGPAWLKLRNATRHNLKGLDVEIPLGRFVCVTGVSGSGKTTLVREVLLPALAEKLEAPLAEVRASDRLQSEQNGESNGDEAGDAAVTSAVLEGADRLARVVLVDQSILAKTPRSNPAVYIGAFDHIREFFAQSDLAKQRGLNASAFSFNSSQGQCQRCRGAGFEKIEMQFLSDVFIRCPDCDGRRYREHILRVKLAPETTSAKPNSRQAQRKTSSQETLIERALWPMSIADLLDSTIEEAIQFLQAFPESHPARTAVALLSYLEEVGLGYLKLGQPINTLSGGESQRLKLVRHLGESCAPSVGSTRVRASSSRTAIPAPNGSPGSTLFLFDEPTTGLHFDDVRVLLRVFQRLVDQGHSVLVIEHNLEVIKCADWLIDLGPDAGDQGGQVVAAGTPSDVAVCPESHTGQALREVLPERPSQQPSALRCAAAERSSYAR